MHVPVLAREVLDFLQVRPEGTYVDCTAGAGGHAALIAAQLSTGRLLALDRDPSAVALARERLAPYPQARVCEANYGELADVLAGEGIGGVDGVLIDAGVSSMQLDEGARGFSLQADGPLDMRMSPSQPVTAAAYLHTVSEEALKHDLRTLGDIGPAGRIARAIIARRDQGALKTTRDLTQAVADGLNISGKVPQEAYTVFQAIRIRVNDELHWLETGIRQGIEALAPGGRIVAIAFHSGEDRVVKSVFRELSTARKVLHPDGRVREVTPPMLRTLTKKPVRPGADEIQANPRSRSARLRAAERLAA